VRAKFKSAIAIAAMAVSFLGGCGSMPSASQSELATNSDQTEAQQRAQIRMQLAIGYFGQGQLNTALDEIKQSLQINPDYADAYGLRALVYMEMGETRLAEENFQRAMKLAPDSPELSNNYGWFLCQNGRERQSLGYFEASLKNRAYQSPAKALNNAGVCSLKLKDVASAERYLTQAFQQDPGNADTNANLAKLYYVRGDYERARFYITRAIKAEKLTADALWTAIRVERKLGDRATETGYVTQLRRRYPNSPEYAAFLRGAFDD
jgi:type IV pilus assembly protein PilF